MTPKEQAEGLIDKMKCVIENSGLNAMFDYSDYKKAAIKCALLTVNELIKIAPYQDKDKADTVEQLRASDAYFMKYWEQVEIELKANER